VRASHHPDTRTPEAATVNDEILIDYAICEYTSTYIGAWVACKPTAISAITSTSQGPNYILLTLPRSLIGSIANGQAGPKLPEQRSREALSEDVGVL
jgi:hypothetical protein